MRPLQTPTCNLVLVAPGCDDLPVWRRTKADGDAMDTVTSYWVPTPEELASLAAGLPLVLSFLGSTHPPILVRVGDDS